MATDGSRAGRFDGRVALVTGGGSGIGAASARRLAAEGARVAVLGRTREDLDDVVASIEQAGGTAMAVPGDVAEADDTVAACDRIVGEWGRLDVVVANAGVNGVWAPIDELGADDFRHTLDVNLTGTYLTIRAAVPHLRAHGGAVVVTSSVNGTRMFSNTGATAYATSKAGQVALARMLALELASDGIRVNTICPGAIESDIDSSTEDRGTDEVAEPVEFPEGEIPLTDGAPGTAEQAAAVVAFLASDDAAHVTGAEVFVDGAQSLLQG
ncbi:SDR family oxidoreductase [Salsipaludibacter albus]|uniref:SDR family oxidoreductase n=1 Tax=Salsipaludibacter albus TaxID=2849650 RepID=UPI001EE4B0AD|nr:SDR family NAD(P)-dependent oxidoreductase [Salsipaludibacter albus]MBY5163880.1 SDR family oxidoreductase [Salsipaludibacter albus]